MYGPLSPASQGKGFQATVNRFFVEFEFMICFPAASFMSFVPKIVRTCVNLQMPFAIYFTSVKNKLYAREEKCGKDWHACHSIYIRTVSSQCLLTTLLNQLKLVYGPFGQSNMHSTFGSCSRLPSKETNAPLNKRG